MDYRVISIGCLAAHPLWGERAPARTGHATTTLILAEDRRILVDPGLPSQVLSARLSERANLAPDDVTDLFFTSFQPDTTRGVDAFTHADWWVSPEERETVGVAMAQRLRAIRTGEGIEAGADEDELAAVLERGVAILQRANVAREEFAHGVFAYPMPGVTPGLTGLLIEGTRFTTLVCGDAIPTVEHLEGDRVLPGAHDLDAAKASMQEALEVADLLVLGRDNLAVNPGKRPF
ncbi:MAG: MBL fold metallo-hydrolase [Phycisphaerales bacterium]|nr:MBL fold metallo-hydrolase [Phycisphaerales bacterium]